MFALYETMEYMRCYNDAYVADSFPVECVLSGVCAVRDHGVHAVLQ